MEERGEYRVKDEWVVVARFNGASGEVRLRRELYEALIRLGTPIYTLACSTTPNVHVGEPQLKEEVALAQDASAD